MSPTSEAQRNVRIQQFAMKAATPRARAVDSISMTVTAGFGGIEQQSEAVATVWFRNGLACYDAMN
jgi:hypothetical protein